MGQQDVLNVLENANGKKMSAKEISIELGRSHNNVNKVIKRLVLSGFIDFEIREISYAPGRVKFYYIKD